MKLRVKLVRSTIGRTPAQRRTVTALGLRKINQEVVHEDSDSIRGMLLKVKHLVEVHPMEGKNEN